MYERLPLYTTAAMLFGVSVFVGAEGDDVSARSSHFEKSIQIHIVSFYRSSLLQDISKGQETACEYRWAAKAAVRGKENPVFAHSVGFSLLARSLTLKTHLESRCLLVLSYLGSEIH